MVGTDAHIQRMNKFSNEVVVDGVSCGHHKFDAVAGGNIKYLRNVEQYFYLLQLLRQVLLADHQFPQFLQLDLLVRKSNYF